MKVSDILEQIVSTRGSIAKTNILKTHADNVWLQKVLCYGLNQMMPFHIVKVPRVKNDERSPRLTENISWSHFFHTADKCASRVITGNEAINSMHEVFKGCTAEEEKWMRKILKKQLSIGASTKTVNKVFHGLIPTFDVALAQKFEEKRLKGKTEVAVEPKLDGIRCFAIVESGAALLYARSGKLISNFDSTIGVELSTLPDGCYDGEIMGEDFIALMRQAYRKENVVTEGTYLSLFDYIPMEEWKTREAVMTCRERYELLANNLKGAGKINYLKCIPRYNTSANYGDIKAWHDEFVSKGFEGAMIKDLDAPYKFGRGYEVMKLKAFHDVDLTVDRLEEGTGKHAGRLGAVVVSYKGTEVKVGSGFTDELRESIWSDPDSFVGRMVEVRYQEVTPDGSLRFPTFVCFRNDRQ
jgi:DNA ligase 1